MSPKTEFAQTVDFNLWLTKSVLNGRGNEIIDLVRTNLFR